MNREDRLLWDNGTVTVGLDHQRRVCLGVSSRRQQRGKLQAQVVLPPATVPRVAAMLLNILDEADPPPEE